MALQNAECGRRRQSRAPLHQRLIVLSAVILALGVSWGTVALFQTFTPRAVGNVSAEDDPMKRSAADSIPVGSAPLSVAVLADVQTPSIVAAAGRPSPDLEQWRKVKPLKTVDGEPGGSLRFDAETGEVLVCDREPGDGKRVRGKVTLQGKVVEAEEGEKLAVNVVGDDTTCELRTIKNYNRQDDYRFQVCLADDKAAPDGFCNTSGNTSPWPKPDRKEDHCKKLTGQEHMDCTGGEMTKCNDMPAGPVKYLCKKAACSGSTYRQSESCTGIPAGASDGIPPPSGRRPSLDESPDAALPNSPAADYDDPRMTVPMRRILQWLTWATLGACVAGYMLVGAKMAINHKRGEAHGHAVELGWVLIATVIAATGLAIYFVAFVVTPI